jgi:hypothetical protein
VIKRQTVDALNGVSAPSSTSPLVLSAGLRCVRCMQLLVAAGADVKTTAAAAAAAGVSHEGGGSLLMTAIVAFGEDMQGDLSLGSSSSSSSSLGEESLTLTDTDRRSIHEVVK